MTYKWTLNTVPPKSVAKNYYANRDNWLTAFDKIFDEAFKDNFPSFYKEYGIDPFGKSSYPKVNVIANDTHIAMEADVAGYSKEDISVLVEDNTLTISGNASAKTEQSGETVYVIRELKRSSFSRSFMLSEDLETDKIDARFDNGILQISIPRREKIPEKNTVKKVTIK